MGAAALCFAACTTGDVGKTYQATGVAGNKKVNPAFVNVNIDDVKPTFLHYLSHGYTFLGWSGFSNLRGSERATALQQAKKVGADVIIYNSDVIGSEVHGVAHTVMDSPGRTITATTNGYNSGSFNVYGDVNGYGTTAAAEPLIRKSMYLLLTTLR